MKSFLMILCLAMLTFAIIGIANSITVNLGTAGDFMILSKTGITTTGVTQIVGNIGVSPIAAGAITGFGLAMDSSGTFSRSTLVIGKVYASDYAAPTPSMLTTAIGDMQTAYANAAGQAADVTELGTGNIGGLTIAPGVYKWGTGVIIPTDVTLSGDENAVWIFQIAQTLNISSGKKVILTGGAQAKNIFWQVAGSTTLETYSMFNGIILDQTNIALQTGAVLNGRALAQTAVTLDANTITIQIADTILQSLISAKTTPSGSSNVWNIVGPSVVTLDKSIVNNFGSGFGTTWIAWRWNPTLARWEVPTTFGSNPVTSDPFDAGTSWLYALDGDGSYITKSVQGTQVDTSTPFSVPLKIGWNLICNPFDFSVAWSDSSIKIKYGAWEGTPTQAEAANYVDNRAVWYNPDTKAYVTRYSNEGTPYSMPKTRGQWLYSTVDGAYVIFPPTASGSPAPPSKPETDSSLWKVEFTLKSSKGSNTVEAIADNRGQTSLHDMNPPSLPISVSRMSFIRDDIELSSDRQKKSSEMTWILSADTTESSSLEWKLIGVPDGYKLTLEDETGKQIDIRQLSKIVIDTGNRYILKALRIPLPKITRLLANYPNPFNPDTWIPYELSAVSEVVIRIYTTTGYLVRTLNLGRKETGYYTTKENSAYWDGKNEYGEQVASGVYFYSIKAGDYIFTRKMVILK